MHLVILRQHSYMNEMLLNIIWTSKTAYIFYILKFKISTQPPLPCNVTCALHFSSDSILLYEKVNWCKLILLSEGDLKCVDNNIDNYHFKIPFAFTASSYIIEDVCSLTFWDNHSLMILMGTFLVLLDCTSISIAGQPSTAFIWIACDAIMCITLLNIKNVPKWTNQVK
jgi:hypothetical protein